MRPGLSPGQPAGGAQQNLPILRRAGAIKAQDRGFVPGRGLEGGALVGAMQQMLQPDPQSLGNAGKVAGQLPGTPGFPLRNGAA